MHYPGLWVRPAIQMQQHSGTPRNGGSHVHWFLMQEAAKCGPGPSSPGPPTSPRQRNRLGQAAADAPRGTNLDVTGSLRSTALVSSTAAPRRGLEQVSSCCWSQAASGSTACSQNLHSACRPCQRPCSLHVWTRLLPYSLTCAGLSCAALILQSPPHTLSQQQ
jgi:hypothetical protein